MWLVVLTSQVVFMLIILKVMIKLAERIRQLREAKNISQRELAKVLGFDHTFIVQIEKGKSSISIETLVLLVKYFGCTAGYLIGIED